MKQKYIAINILNFQMRTSSKTLQTLNPDKTKIQYKSRDPLQYGESWRERNGVASPGVLSQHHLVLLSDVIIMLKTQTPNYLPYRVFKYFPAASSSRYESTLSERFPKIVKALGILSQKLRLCSLVEAW